MTGGDQQRLSILAGTPLLAAVRERHADGAVIAGTSADAAAMSATMIAEGHGNWRTGNVRLVAGLLLLADAIIDTRCTPRGRFARLFQVAATRPHLTSTGLETRRWWCAATTWGGRRRRGRRRRPRGVRLQRHRG